MTAVAEMLQVTEPGIYDGIPEDLYHGDPVPAGSLSVSSAKKLLAPSCPARFRWDRDHPAAPSRAMELGTAAHKLVLGTGTEIVVVDAEDWRTKAAKEAADEARAGGKVPMLPKDHETVLAMAAAVRAHPLAGPIFDPARGGHPEQSFFWLDERWQVWRRGRADWLTDSYIADFKTCASADTSSLSRAVANFRYHQQDAWYSDGIYAITGEYLPFVFIFQEKDAPYLVHVVRLDDRTALAGRTLNDRALELYRDCTESGVWPGYVGDDELQIEEITIPAWAMPREEW